MIYPSNFEDKIGFSRIREMVKDHCLFEPGRELIEALHMLQSDEEIEGQLGPVDEFRHIQTGDEDFPVHQFHDSRKALKKAAVEGAFLEVDELAGLAKSLESVRLIINFFQDREENEYPRLRELTKSVKLYPFVSERIGKILNKHGQVRDNASPELQQVRREIMARQSSVTRLMNKLVKKAQSEGWVEEDIGATFRNGRPVIPVSASYKRSIGGLVHDESTSGKTVFIEPAEVVELSNEIRELEYAERREIIRILTVFTNDIRPYLEELTAMHGFLAEIDAIRARALFAIRIRAIRPKLSESPSIEWFDAIHPLLFLSFQKSGREVVPLNLALNVEGRMLLISGPNAGGKSVCLQTVGLLQYMFQCGMLVPVGEASRFGVFSSIFIDIGDEQSIDNDLSTYSSHLVNMKYFLKHASADSLILIDEFGTGTEPMLGGAIAESILENLNGAGTYGVLTTHYTNLKHFAASSEGIVNGAMLFDNHKMQPLYELQIGKPGSSFAFEIARKIGLPEEVLQHASEKVGQDHIDFDKHLRDVLRDKKYWERKRQKIRLSEKKLEDLMLKYEQELGESEKKRKVLIAEAKKQAEEMLAQANRKIENTIREIKESNAEKEQTREARKKLEAFREVVNKDETAAENELAREYKKLKEREEELKKIRPDLRKKTQQKTTGKPKKEADTTIRVGDTVHVEGQDPPGEVMELRGNNAVVAFGNLKSRVKLVKLTRIESGRDKPSAEKKSSVNLGDWNVSKRRVLFRPEIDVRGKRADEALQKVTELIDEAIMVGASEVHILHGKGDGILRQLIRDFLQTSDVVDSYADEHVERGGAGITVVQFGP
ncbi:MAG: Smr/MutS family protein [Bacteroidales bacterium]|nr:Smr/MutS family protein [Bacteroidales bacterium]MDT8429935.1 Smr/MutS family protein [Bacteroidales bacterium]